MIELPLRIRIHPESNFRSISVNGRSMYMQLDSSKPFIELQYPELYDIAINNKCYGACPYCYIAATKQGENYVDICRKASIFFGNMDMNQRPYQVAIGGAGEPTLHPDFPEFVRVLYDLGIVPNYTTNGMHLTNAVLEATENYVGGVALSCHPHLQKVWQKGVGILRNYTNHLNLHIIPQSINDVLDFAKIFETYYDIIDNFVLLPYQTIGFAKPINTDTVYTKLFNYLYTLSETARNKIAFGAGFMAELQSRAWLNVRTYEPHLFSKYLDMKGDMTLYRSSYEWNNPIKIGLL